MLTLGSPSNPPLVFLHGFLGRGADWLPIASAFAAEYFCLLPDLPGHGANTDLPLDTRLDYDFFVDGLVATLGDILPSPFGRGDGGEGIRPINLIGYSLGGRIGLYLALRYPERIRALVLESTNPGIRDDSARRERARLDDAWAQKLLSTGMSAFVDEWYNIPLFRSLHRHPGLLAQIKAARCQNSPAWMAKVIADLSPGRQPWLGDRLSELTIPTLLLAGSLDEKYASALPGFAARIPHARALTVPFAGHTIHAERTGRFKQILGAFLRKVDTPVSR